jgi:predicted anti-sigma-YlaC factor YlaD
MLTCRQMTELVTDYLEKRMTWRNRVRFQMHLGMCRHCREYVRQMKETIQAAGRLAVEPPPPSVEEQLLERFRDWKP